MVHDVRPETDSTQVYISLVRKVDSIAEASAGVRNGDMMAKHPQTGPGKNQSQ